MAVNVECVYRGGLSVKSTHGPSRAELLTHSQEDKDSPAKEFSPTDLITASLGACMLTVMGKVAEKNGIDFRDAAVIVEKIMAENPSRVQKLSAVFSLSSKYPDPMRRRLEAAAKACPVKRSLHPDLEIELIFGYDQ